MRNKRLPKTFNNEFYVCPVYNEAIDGQKFRISNCERMWGLGVPKSDDNENFHNKKNSVEYWSYIPLFLPGGTREEPFASHVQMHISVQSFTWGIESLSHALDWFKFCLPFENLASEQTLFRSALFGVIISLLEVLEVSTCDPFTSNDSKSSISVRNTQPKSMEPVPFLEHFFVNKSQKSAAPGPFSGTHNTSVFSN